MTKDVEWGPWIGWNGGECPVDGDTVVWIRTMSGEGWMNNTPVNAAAVGWSVDGHPGDVIAYRVKKEPVVEVHNRRVDVCGSLTGVSVVAECTYTDGKLTKIHWEAEDAD